MGLLEQRATWRDASFCIMMPPKFRVRLKLLKGNFRMIRVISAAVVSLLVWQVIPAQAQSARELDDRIRRLEQQLQSMGRGVASQNLPAPGSEEAASLQARVIKLEQLVEQLTGQIEEARYKTGQMSTQLEQLSNDMNYRLAVLEQSLGTQPGAGPNTMPPPPRPSAQRNTPPAQNTMPDDPNVLSRPIARGPATAPPPPMSDGGVRASTPGDTTFGSLATDASGRPLAADPNQAAAPAPQVTTPMPSQPAPQRAPNPGPVAGAQLGVSGDAATDVALPEGTPKQQYDYSFDFLKRQDYGRAETAFREFLKRYPKDPLSGNAQYWLGETHYVRGDYQKAAVEFLNGYQNYPKSNKAPDNLLKLGMAMANIGQTQGACTALGRLMKEYADAGDQIRRSAQAERQKLKCQ
jgi:tol-pal system protein YbgF